MNIALILAGGLGSRMDTDEHTNPQLKTIPKQLMLLKNKPVIEYSIMAFQTHSQIDYIYIVGNETINDQMSVFFNNGYTKLMPLIIGGATRTQSSQNGLRVLASRFTNDDIVLIHDAARPLITKKIITDNINAASQFGACTTVIPITDTVLTCLDGENITAVTDRSTQFLAQTPQSFKIKLILPSLENAPNDATDDTTLLLRRGIPVKMVLGDKRNLKLTTPEDLLIAEAYLK